MLPYFQVFSIPISTYFLVISMACVIGILWFLARSEKRGLIRVTAIDLAMTCLIGGLVGARLLHVLYEEPAYYQASPVAIFEIWNGGFVFFGGVLGAWFAAALFCMVRSEPFWFWADVAILPISLGYAIGRVGCFLNGCCYGKVCELPWAFSMQGAMRHPTQLYAALWELVILIVLVRIEPRVRMSGTLFSTWLVLHSLGRVLMEFFRDDPRGPLLLGVTIGTWMSLAFGLVGLITLLMRSGHRRLAS